MIGFHFFQVTFWTSAALQFRCFPFLTICRCRMQVSAAGSLDCWCLEDFSPWIWKKKYGFKLLMDSRYSFLLHVKGKWFLRAPFLVQRYSSTSPLNVLLFCPELSILLWYESSPSVLWLVWSLSFLGHSRGPSCLEVVVVREGIMLPWRWYCSTLADDL